MKKVLLCLIWITLLSSTVHAEIKAESQTKLDNATKLLEKDLDKLGVFDLKVAEDYYAISQLYFEMGKFDESIEYGLNALKVEMKLKKEDDPLLAKLYFDIGNRYYMHKQHPTAMLYMQKAIDIYSKGKEKDTLLLADSYEAVSSIYINLEDLEKSLIYAKKCLVIREKKLKKTDEALQRAQQNIEFLEKSQKGLQQ